MLEKKQIRMIFSFEFKMGGKAAEMTLNINNAFGLGPANEHTVQWWFEKFCKGDKSLEDEEHSGQPSEVDNDQLRGSSKLILLKLHKRLLKNWTLTILWSFGIWSKLERWKSSIIGCLMSWRKKKCCFEVSSSLILFCSILFIFTQSWPTLCNPMDCMYPTRLICPWNSLGKNTGVGCHFLF